MLDFLFLLLFLYLAFIAIVGSIALYGKAIDKISEKNQARAVKIHGFVMKALKFAFVVVVFLGIVTGGFWPSCLSRLRGGLAALEGLALPGDLPSSLYSRKLAGWQVLQCVNETLMIDALDNAVNRENSKEGIMVHADRSGQYAPTNFAWKSKDVVSSNRFLSLRKRCHGIALQGLEKRTTPL